MAYEVGSGLGLDDIDGALLVLGLKLKVAVGLLEMVGEFVGAVLTEGIRPIGNVEEFVNLRYHERLSSNYKIQHSLLVNVGKALIEGAELILGCEEVLGAVEVDGLLLIVGPDESVGAALLVAVETYEHEDGCT